MKQSSSLKQSPLSDLTVTQSEVLGRWVRAFAETSSAGADRQQLLDHICQLLSEWISDSSVFWISNKKDQRFDLLCGQSLSSKAQGHIRTLFVPESELWQQLAQSEPFIHEIPCSNEVLSGRACWSVPVGSEKQTLSGVLVVVAPTDALDRFAQLALSIGGAILSLGLHILQQQNRLRYITEHDAVTGLYNETRLQRDIENLFQINTPFGLIYIDLDNFKYINDVHGHDHGDELLVRMARRIERLLIHYPGRLYRGKGDEFYILSQVCQDENPKERIENLCKCILEEVSKPIPMNKDILTLSCSMGISCSEMAKGSYYELRRMADAALAAAKESGRRTWRFFSEDMVAELSEMLRLETMLHEALKQDGQLDVYYQPILDATTGQVKTFEALVRWKHPQKGFIPPFKFIPVAERSGLIRALDEKVLDLVIEDLKQWQAAQGSLNFTVAINLSAIEFEQQHIQSMAQKVSRSGCASHIEFEMTESMMMEDTEQTLSLIRLLKKSGIAALSMDDFGTGYSSLGYLKKFPVDKLKIDQSLVRDINTDEQDLAIARAVSALGQALGLKIVAEGVETQTHREILGTVGVDLLQGYLFAKPMPGEEVLPWLQRLEEERRLDWKG